MRTSEQEAVLAEIDRESARRLLVDLVNIESPPGDEARLSVYLIERFRSMGLRAVSQVVDEGRPNAVGVLEGTGRGLSLMLNGHLDTSHTGREPVGVRSGAGILASPSPGAQAVSDGDRVYGLGAYNMKGGLAAMTVAAEAIRRAGVRLRGDLVVAGVIGEIVMAPVDEFGERTLRGYTRGTQYLVTHGVMTDLAIVAEPTAGDILVGHFGVHWVKISTYGLSVNTAYSEGVVSPIDRAQRILEALRRWIPSYRERVARQYAYMNVRPIVRVAAIKSGTPWRLARPGGMCSVYVDVRTPGSPQELKRELVQLVQEVKASVRSEDPEFEADVEFYLTQPGAEIDPQHDLVVALQAAHTTVCGWSPVLAYSAINSDASVLTHYGIPAVNYGPSSREPGSLVGGREFQDVTDVADAARVFALTALDICNRPG
jgi:acetylornithine deacetylase